MIHLENISKVYRLGANEVCALCDVSLQIASGELVAIMGPSGSGKSTLMNILGCLDTATAGTYELDGRMVSALGDDEMAAVRNRHIGFVFQTFHLLPRMTAQGNVEVPLMYAGLDTRERRERAGEALAKVGLADRMLHKPNELSGGQRQRVAIARALVNQPSLILADEPTGNLDSLTGDDILALFRRLHSAGTTIIIVTHDPQVAEQTQRIITLKDGSIVSDTKVP